MNIRDATVEDVPQMSAFLTRLVEMGKRVSPSDEEFVEQHYINDPRKVQCALADANGMVLGFQALKLAVDGNIYGVTPGWGVIGTHVNPDVARRGVGKSLFASTLQAAKAHGLQKIDASIGASNAEGLAYYEAMGFRTYRTGDGIICKCYEVS